MGEAIVIHQMVRFLSTFTLTANMSCAIVLLYSSSSYVRYVSASVNLFGLQDYQAAVSALLRNELHVSWLHLA